jgi:hypothetical protein
MGYRCPVLLTFFGLAMVSVPASLSGSQQAPPTLYPPSPPSKRATSPQAAPTEKLDFRKHSSSHLRLKRGDRYIDVYLFAPDEKVEVLKDPYCGGDKGSKVHSGHFQLISVADNVKVSTMNLDPDDWFVEGKAHDGARLFHDPKSDQDVVVVYQYGTCSSETVQFVSSDAKGYLFSVPFLERDGRTWKERLTGPTGAIPHLENGALTFCFYVNTLRYHFCDAYTFDGENFLDNTKWMTREIEAPVKGMNDAGIAARTLFEFLTALSDKSYSAAAYYAADFRLAGTALGQGPLSIGQKAAFLETYCTSLRGQCLPPTAIESKTEASPPGTLLFQVSFQNSDFKPLKIGSRSDFDFRVARTANGFKVYNLPPQLP